MSSEIFENREMDFRSLYDDLEAKINIQIPRMSGGQFHFNSTHNMTLRFLMVLATGFIGGSTWLLVFVDIGCPYDTQFGEVIELAKPAGPILKNYEAMNSLFITPTQMCIVS